jgi:hypothetical protein
LLPLAADDPRSGGSRPGRARARVRPRRRGPRFYHQQEARHARRRSVARRSRPPHLLRRRDGDHEPRRSRRMKLTLTMRSPPRRGPAPLPVRHRGEGYVETPDPSGFPELGGAAREGELGRLAAPRRTSIIAPPDTAHSR